MNAPVERKVYAATLGAGAGTTVSQFGLWAVDQIWWPDPEVDIPIPVAGFVTLVITVGLTFITGWLAKHGDNEIMYGEDPANPHGTL
jgi:hypothetical protein